MEKWGIVAMGMNGIGYSAHLFPLYFCSFSVQIGNGMGAALNRK